MLALGRCIVSEETIIKCDVCGTRATQPEYNLPAPWRTVTIKAKGSPFTEPVTHHVCARQCAASLFAKLSADLGGVAMHVNPQTGQPYR